MNPEIRTPLNDIIGMDHVMRRSHPGVDLTEEQQGRVFKAFEPADSFTTRQQCGTVPGLVMHRWQP